ncbi:MAG: hypothetical protein C3F11_12195 [Methylocystaceae bacterium]|nr:MAG: hypothetical protein C3F11_12195 [Methylocystaceae bacterium]
MTRDQDVDEVPFSRPLAAADVPENGLDVSIAAEAGERAALARADGLNALSRLEADLHVAREGAGGLRVTGELRADIRQTCVVSLEEFDATVVEPIDLRFAPPAPVEDAPRGDRHWRDRRTGSAPEPKEEKTSRHIVALDDDAPDPLIEGRVDLGSVVAEFLALALDPYPRKPGASFAESAAAGEPETASPFAGLRDALEKGREN